MAKKEVKVGRPSKFTQKLVDRICLRIAEGESLRDICKDSKMPVRKTIHLWLLDEEKELFLHQYNTACNVRAENMFDELNDIADDGTNDFMEKRGSKDGETYTVTNPEAIGRSRLRVDTRKWYLSKIMPKKYGEKLDVTSDGKEIKTNTIIIKDFSADETDDQPQV